MLADVSCWLRYAEENLAVARLAINGHYYNSGLQNIQQAVEKFLKAAVLQKGLPLRRVHSIQALRDQLMESGSNVDLSNDECELLDSIYLPSKYPLGGALPDFHPDLAVCNQCLEIVEKVQTAVLQLL